MGIVDHRKLAAGLVGPVQRAGAIVMDYYTNGVATEHKADASPVTAADRDSEAVLAPALAALLPDIAIIAEEAASAEGITPEPGKLFALIDPLDGTKEFLSGETDFTLNVALVQDGRPCFGLVYAPALSELFVTLAADQAVLARLEPGGTKQLDALEPTPLHTRALPARLAAMTSRSHLNPATQAYLERLPVGETVMAGSSLKFCRIAEGKADVYPRLARTMEWDTAAGDAVLRAAGGTVLDETGAPLTYGKAQAGYANGSFVAWGRMPRAEFAAAKSE
jgi:3'(2'), 5'-bisphosphate nucleotidase